ncbi:MAG TPA: hypothetical protein VF576_08940 [Rubricoccaceae bacterium]
MPRTYLFALTLVLAAPASATPFDGPSVLDAPDVAGLPTWAAPAEGHQPAEDLASSPSPFPGGTPPQGVPADGGLLLLAGAGALLAARRLQGRPS